MKIEGQSKFPVILQHLIWNAIQFFFLSHNLTEFFNTLFFSLSIVASLIFNQLFSTLEISKFKIWVIEDNFFSEMMFLKKWIWTFGQLPCLVQKHFCGCWRTFWKVIRRKQNKSLFLTLPFLEIDCMLWVILDRMINFFHSFYHFMS